MPPIVEIKNVNIYQSGNLILSDVNLTVNQGEFVYLVGKTGTGKSSLLKTLYGELPLNEGSASVRMDTHGKAQLQLQVPVHKRICLISKSNYLLRNHETI